MPQGEVDGQLVFVENQAEQAVKTPPHPAKTQAERKPVRQSKSTPVRAKAITLPQMASRATEPSPATDSPVAAVDTMSMLTAARERRRALEAAAAEENSAAQQASHGSSDNDIAMANINRNLQSAIHPRKGTNGIFTIISKGARIGQFSFRGWTNDPRQSTHETFEVDAGIGGNVELAIVRKMIELIRKHYAGNFNWESSRQGRVLELSARPADNAFLEEFMMREFFGS